MAPKSKNNFYCVARDRTVGIFTDWSNCEISVHKFHNVVHKGFQTLEQAIHFMMATGDYSLCQDIQVHNLDSVIHVLDIGHKCTTGCSPLITQHSDSQEEDAEVHIKQEGQDTTESKSEVPENDNSENTSVKSDSNWIRGWQVNEHLQFLSRVKRRKLECDSM